MHVILLIAVLARVPYVFLMSYTHDELSALYRLQGHSFTDLFSSFGLTDAHPPLVQVFLYFYTGIFGDAEWIVKLPFCILGIYSVYLVYKVGKEFYGENAGLITAAFLSVSQLYIYHSLVARPYIPAVVFTLLFALYWLRCFHAREINRRNVAGYIVFAWLAFATHHFATLTVFLVIVLGIFLLDKKQFITYLKINGVLLILSLPFLYVIKFQLQFKGIGDWLAIPEKNYLVKFFAYLLHYNMAYVFIVALLVAGAMIFAIRKRVFTAKPHAFVFAAVFLVVYLAGYIYSVYRAPILQFSLLQFALPFFLLWIFSAFNSISNVYAMDAFIGIIVGIGLWSLLITRQNHQALMDTPYRAFAEFCEPYKQKYAGEKVLVVTSERMEFVSRYMQQAPGFKIISTYQNPKSTGAVLAAINKFNPSRVIAGNCDFNTFGLLRSYFPYVKSKKQGFLNEFYMLSSDPRERYIDAAYTALANESIRFDSVQQFHTLMDTPFVKLGLTTNRQFVFQTEMKSTDANPLILVTEFHENGKRVFWNGTDLFVRPSTEAFNHVYGTFDMDNELRKYDLTKLRVVFYLWNSKLVKSEMKMKPLFEFHEPNYKYYGIIQDF